MNLGEFYTDNTHVNDTTGCVIWDGESSKGIPIVAGVVNVPVRKFVYESLNGLQPYRTQFVPMCENARCVKLEHIKAVSPERKAHEYPTEKVAEVWKMYHDWGMRQEAIATKLNIDPSTVSKYIKAAKASLEESEK